ncbi:MAG TPA: beta-galactosidase [Acidobacteriaceae bacterium]
MRLRTVALLATLALPSAPALLAQPAPAPIKVAVFFQPGFPTIASDPIDEPTLRSTLGGEPGTNLTLLDLAALRQPDSLKGADLLVLPYGSAVPADAWQQIRAYLRQGGNLLVIGGQPLRVPVRLAGGAYVQEREQDSYARDLDLRHTYEVPVAPGARFAWKTGYTWKTPKLDARRYFAVEGRLDGLGYMEDATGLLTAAPVIVVTRESSRIVALDFDPQPGYWKTADGATLLHTAADYAAQGATDFSLEVLFSTIRPGELPQITAHLRQPHPSASPGEIHVELRAGDKLLEKVTLPATTPDTSTLDLDIPFRKPLPPGFYTVSASYSWGGQQRAFYRNGFQVEDRSALTTGPALGVHGDFLSLDSKPFFPVGTNYFTTEENGWDFSGPRNAWVWDKDFAEMEQHGVSFVRTGIWMPNAKFVEQGTGEANERFLRNLEAYLAAAHRHHIAINFTLFAMVPRSGFGGRPDSADSVDPNPYLDERMLRSEQAYVHSVAARFHDVPWLCWDLINEPSFSNPRHIFHGNYPNNDPSEQRAWHSWLARRYGTVATLASAWSTTPEELGSFDSIALPSTADLAYERYGNPRQVRAVDYGLFAQAMFSDWVRGMISTIHSTGSTQLINVGQDEGGVTDRVLNQIYSNAGVSFTTNHTYWQDDALLWDSVAAKRPGLPNITGETGYQPAWAPDGTWRFDELTGLGLTERKWAFGFAAGSSGAMQWDWAREVDFGMQRSDGSAKLWENMMRDLGAFARQTAPSATALLPPQVAIVLPNAYQLSIDNGIALQAQQRAVRTLFAETHQAAYAVGESSLVDAASAAQSGSDRLGSATDLLGSPRLILLPAPGSLSDAAWQTILARVQAGATLLASGAFLNDEHMHDTGRQASINGHSELAYKPAPLLARQQHVTLPGGALPLTYPGLMITRLQQAVLPGSRDWVELPVGRGRILYSPLPLEISDDIPTLAAVYRYALHAAGVEPAYTLSGDAPGITLAPTSYPAATLYVLTSESSADTRVTFRDTRSGKEFSGTIAAGHAALLLIGTDGRLITSYHWPAAPPQ